MSLPGPPPADSGPIESVWRSRDFRVCWGLTALFNVAWGVVFPLRNLYFREPWIGLSFQQIGWLGFVRSATMASVPLLFGILSDRSGRRKPWIMGGFLLSSAATALYLVSHTYWQLVGVTFLTAVAFIAYNLNVNALVTTTLHDKARGRQYGQYRVSGSIGYALATFALIPLVALDKTYSATFLSGAGIYLACLIVAFLGIKETPATGEAASQWGAWREVLRERNLVILYACLAVSSIGTSMGFQFLSNHLDETFHLSKTSIGRIVGLASILEIPALIGLGWASDRWGRKPILALAFIMGGVRWSLIGLAPSLGWVVVAQFLWGMGFAGYTVGVALITDLVRPAARGSAMGMLQLSWAFGSILGPPLGGYLAEHIGLPIVFRVGGAFAIAGGVGLLAFLRPPDAVDATA
ncbi:MFS transporter [Candidatus Poribacteria bacterium]|nr:MFS transporter [Candidatus Poribacteria bacterium]MBT5712447.1 MFS transporter [Candidatus Poribacteria bacterium]MBT7100269.1 MFS transporter [Candidatus Poribacteria bacterium]MBT7808972.1 MFS transporter [Candidatus Poribacteria bacterium]